MYLKLVHFASFNSLKNLAHFAMVLHFLFSSLSFARHSVPAEGYLHPLLMREEEKASQQEYLISYFLKINDRIFHLC
jgi:hypothetical protein